MMIRQDQVIGKDPECSGSFVFLSTGSLHHVCYSAILARAAAFAASKVVTLTGPEVYVR